MSKTIEQNLEKSAKNIVLLRWLFLALVVSLPLVNPFSLVLFNTAIPAADFIFLAVFAVWLVALLRGKISFRNSRFYLFLFLYAAAMTVSTVFSTDFDRSAKKLAGEFYLLTLAVLAFNVVRNTTELRNVIAAWSIGTVATIAASLIGFVLFYAGYKTRDENFALFQFGSLPAGNFPRLQASFYNANMACNYLSVSLVLTLIADHFGRLKKTASKILQAGIWFAAFFTFSPGIGGMFLAQGLWNWVKFRKTEKHNAAFVSIIIGILMAIVFFAATIVHPDTENTDQGFRLPVVNYTIEPASRALVWRQAVANIAENPLFGKGLDAEAAALYYTTLSGEPHFLSDAHNTFLSVIVQNGFVGFAAFSLLIIFLLKRFLPFEFGTNPNAVIRTGLGIAFISAFLYQGLAGSYENARHLWVLIGLLAGFGEREDYET